MQATNKLQKKFININVSHILKHLSDYKQIDFTGYKISAILKCIERQIIINKLSTLDDYYHLIASSSSHIETLCNDILNGSTRFFRDYQPFESLKGYILEDIITHNKKSLYIWVPGCSTGEEAYSIAIILFEIMKELDTLLDIKILATDINHQSLKLAKTGKYHEQKCLNINQDRLDYFFIKKNCFYTASDKIKNIIHFSQHNLITDPPALYPDIISCRNTLIYFNEKYKKEILYSFHQCLKNDGLLMLGTSEANINRSIFSIINRKNRIYKKVISNNTY